jgi:hypothetical protein
MKNWENEGSYVMRQFIICTLHQTEQTIIQGDQIKEDGTNGARTERTGVRNMYILLGKPKGKRLLARPRSI